LLGVEADANADEIKKSYRKMAMKFHPDKVLLSYYACMHFIYQNFRTLITRKLLIRYLLSLSSSSSSFSPPLLLSSFPPFLLLSSDVITVH
jgi:hypothetical protein